MKSKKARTYRKGKEKLRQMRRSLEVNHEAFTGKLAIIHTYEKLGKLPPKDLVKRVADKRNQLVNRGGGL